MSTRKIEKCKSHDYTFRVHAIKAYLQRATNLKKHKLLKGSSVKRWFLYTR